MGDKIVVINITILFSSSSFSSFFSFLLGRDEVVEVLGIFFFFLFLVSSRRSLRGDF